MDLQRPQRDGRKRRKLLVLESEAELRRIELNRPLDVGDDVANAVKRSGAVRNGGFSGRKRGSRSAHDALAISGTPYLIDSPPGAEFRARATACGLLRMPTCRAKRQYAPIRLTG